MATVVPVMASLPARPTETTSPPSSARTPATPAKVDAPEARKRMADALHEFVEDHRELLTALAK